MKNKLKERIKNAHLVERAKQGIKKRFFSFLFLVSLIFLLVLIFLPRVESNLQSFIVRYGLIAIFLISFLADMLMQPIGPDVPLFIGIVLGFHPIQVLAIVLVASYLATVVGYNWGVRFGAEGFRKIYGNKKYLKTKTRYEKYSLIVPVAAFTPIPYVPICWVSGIFRMNKIKFFLYALIPRTIRLSLVALFAFITVS
jgi:membrane protein YqaA with SNARE-associated domain